VAVTARSHEPRPEARPGSGGVGPGRLPDLVQGALHCYRGITRHYRSGQPAEPSLDALYREHARLLGELNRRLLQEGERLTEPPLDAPGRVEVLDYCLSVFGEREYCLLESAPLRPPPYFSPFGLVRWVERFVQDVQALQGQRIARWLGGAKTEQGRIAAAVCFDCQRSGRIHRRALYVPIRDREVLGEGAHDQGVLVHWNVFDPDMANLDAYAPYGDENVQQGRIWRTDWGHRQAAQTQVPTRLPPDHIVKLGDAILPG
jgi:hypothetical protein